MSLAPDRPSILARARADLRMGVPVVLRHDGAFALVSAAETLTAERLADLCALPGPAGARDHPTAGRNAQGARL